MSIFKARTEQLVIRIKMPTEYITARSDNAEIKLYKRRWLIMALFMWYAITSAIHPFELTSITNIMVRYYNVSAIQVQWTAIMFSVGYVILVFPALFTLEKLGVRYTMIMASTGALIGGCIKIFSVTPDRFFLAVVGQIFNATCNVFTFCIAVRLAAIWFGGKEIGLAGALALLGDQIGSAISFLLPTILVADDLNSEVIENGLFRMHTYVAIAEAIDLILIILFFKTEPEYPPSKARARQREEEEINNVGNLIKEILSSGSFLLVALSYGLVVSACYCFSTLLNQIVLLNFPNHTRDAGNIGFFSVISGMVGSLLGGYILDRTKRFKGHAITLTTGASISMTLFTIALKFNNILYVYITSAVLCFFLLGFYATGIQMCIEITYPISESISTATTFLFVFSLSFLTTTLYSYALQEYGDLTANMGMISVLLISALFACLMTPDLQRQKAEKSETVVELKEFLVNNDIKIQSGLHLVKLPN